MATIIKTDGTEETIALLMRDCDERLRQLQDAVGGLVEIVGRTGDGGYVLANERGRLLDLPVNRSVSQRLGYEVVGDCLLLPRNECLTE